MSSIKQQANRMAFGQRHGKSRSKSDAQIKRATKRLKAAKTK